MAPIVRFSLYAKWTFVFSYFAWLLHGLRVHISPSEPLNFLFFPPRQHHYHPFLHTLLPFFLSLHVTIWAFAAH